MNYFESLYIKIDKSNINTLIFKNLITQAQQSIENNLENHENFAIHLLKLLRFLTESSSRNSIKKSSQIETIIVNDCESDSSSSQGLSVDDTEKLKKIIELDKECQVIENKLN